MAHQASLQYIQHRNLALLAAWRTVHGQELNYLLWYLQLKTNARKYTKSTKLNCNTNELNTGKKFNMQNALAHKIPYSKLNRQNLRNSPGGDVPKVRLLLQRSSR